MGTVTTLINIKHKNYYLTQQSTIRKSELTIWLSLLVGIRDDDRSIPECQDQATLP